jgi:hypothetical protein
VCAFSVTPHFYNIYNMLQCAYGHNCHCNVPTGTTMTVLISKLNKIFKI